jgi:hypothetical protein
MRRATEDLINTADFIKEQSSVQSTGIHLMQAIG